MVDSDDRAMAAQAAWMEAAMLTDGEMRRILQRRKVDELIGAGTQARVADPLAQQMLRLAAEKEPDNPVTWAALSYRAFTRLANTADDQQAIRTELMSALRRWQSCDPGNSAPIYLQAAVCCTESNWPAATALLSDATIQERFDTCQVPLQRRVVAATRSVGYPAFTAYIIAIGNGPGIVAWSKLKLLTNATPAEVGAMHNLLRLGQRVSHGPGLLDELVGFSIESAAINRLPKEDYSSEKARIAERRQLVTRAVRYLVSPAMRKVTEPRWITYFEDCLTRGEFEAIQSLVKDNGDSL